MGLLVMLVGHQDHDVVAGIHGCFEVMRDQQDTAAEIMANLVDQFMEHVRPRDIDALDRFVEDQQIGPVYQRSGTGWTN